MREFIHETEANSFLKESGQLRLSAGPYQSQIGSSHSRADSSKPAVKNNWLSVGYVAMILVKPISAMAQLQPAIPLQCLTLLTV